MRIASCIHKLTLAPPLPFVNRERRLKTGQRKLGLEFSFTKDVVWPVESADALEGPELFATCAPCGIYYCLLVYLQCWMWALTNFYATYSNN